MIRLGPALLAALDEPARAVGQHLEDGPAHRIGEHGAHHVDLDDLLARSRLLHRLRTIGVPWGEPDTGRRGTGTFREQWREEHKR